MIRRQLRILLLEDSVADAELIHEELERRGLKIATHRTDTARDFEHALVDFSPHVVVCDNAVPNFDTMRVLRMTRALRPEAPVIVVSGAMDVKAIVSAIRGALKISSSRATSRASRQRSRPRCP